MARGGLTKDELTAEERTELHASLDRPGTTPRQAEGWTHWSSWRGTERGA
jgi:hypothetical protein